MNNIIIIIIVMMMMMNSPESEKNAVPASTCYAASPDVASRYLTCIPYLLGVPTKNTRKCFKEQAGEQASRVASQLVGMACISSSPSLPYYPIACPRLGTYTLPHHYTIHSLMFK